MKAPVVMISPQPTALLLLSDIHFGSMSESPDFTCGSPNHPIAGAKSMKANLIETVKGTGVHIDAILVLGDLTSTARPDEFSGCVRAVNDIADKIGVFEKDIFYTFGNHDTNWRISKMSEKCAEEAADDGYLTVASSVGDIFVRNSSKLTPGPLLGSGVANLGKFDLIVANTGFFNTHAQMPKHGKLGEVQFAWLKQVLEAKTDASRWRIMMLHHHPFNYPYPTPGLDISCIEEGPELTELLGHHNVDLVCHGHRHHPMLFTEMRNMWKAPVTFFCAGSVAVGSHERSNGHIPNFFHIMKLDSRTQSGAAMGSLLSFRYSASQGWLPAQRSDVFRLDYEQKFGSYVTHNDLEREVEVIIDAALSSGQGTYCDLPALTALPFCLQCLCSEDLSALLKTVALSKHAGLVGTYPSADHPPILVRK